jgi:hypothetical protein
MNKEIQIEYITKQLFELGNIDIVDSVFDDNYIAHDGDKKFTGKNL